MAHPLSDQILAKIFKKSSRNPSLIGTNEGIFIEYKKSFGWKSLSEYLKAMASFANRDGGYIIFGIENKPHAFIGLQSDVLKRFESIDNQQWTTNLRDYFSPEIIWEKKVFVFEGNSYGIIYTYSAKEKPIICKKDADELRKGAIYYRYNSQNSEIDYPELHQIIEYEKNKINNSWMRAIKQLSDLGIAKTAILDLQRGKITGPNSALFIDEKLLNKINFVQEGSFVETGGNPALKIVGEVQTVVGAHPVIVEQEKNKAINADEIIISFITQKHVNNPMEFVKQICYQTTGNMPVYYYLKIADKSKEEALSFIYDVPINSQSKDRLIKRIKELKLNYCELLKTTSYVSDIKYNYMQNILDETLVIPTSLYDIKYCLAAIRGITREKIHDHKDYILNIMYDIYINYYNNPDFSSTKPEFRYALCWIDEAIYL